MIKSSKLLLLSIFKVLSNCMKLESKLLKPKIPKFGKELYEEMLRIEGKPRTHSILVF